MTGMLGSASAALRCVVLCCVVLCCVVLCCVVLCCADFLSLLRSNSGTPETNSSRKALKHGPAMDR